MPVFVYFDYSLVSIDLHLSSLQIYVKTFIQRTKSLSPFYMNNLVFYIIYIIPGKALREINLFNAKSKPGYCRVA